MVATKSGPPPLIGGPTPPTPLISACVDWISYTLPTGSLLPATPYSKALDMTWEPGHGMIGYKESRLYKDGRICLLSDRADMGTHWIYSGSTLNNLAERGFMPWHILDQAFKAGAKFTRIDLAMDCKDTDLSLAELEAKLEAGEYDASVTKFSRVKGVGDNPGYTLYLGSRQSERMGRFYDKAAETKTEGNWIRLEIELKGSRAQFAATQIVNGTMKVLPTLTSGLLRGLIDFPDCAAWQQVHKGEIVVTGKSVKKTVNTKDWLMNSVARTIGRLLAREHDDTFWFDFQGRVFKFKAEYEERQTTDQSGDQETK